MRIRAVGYRYSSEGIANLRTTVRTRRVMVVTVMSPHAWGTRASRAGMTCCMRMRIVRASWSELRFYWYPTDTTAWVVRGRRDSVNVGGVAASYTGCSGPKVGRKRWTLRHLVREFGRMDGRRSRGRRFSAAMGRNMRGSICCIRCVRFVLANIHLEGILLPCV